jgi:hypothetical protein
MEQEQSGNGSLPLHLEGTSGADEIETNRSQPEVITLDRIRAGEQPFASWGYSDLKVVKHGVEKTLRIPIKSIGMAELMEKIARKAPNPPRRLETVSKDSPHGQALGLKRDRVIEIEDHADQTYQERMRDYELKSTYSVVLHGLAINVETDEGAVLVKANDEHSRTEVKDEDAAILVLKNSGLTDTHLFKLAEDVRAMSRREKEITDRE